MSPAVAAVLFAGVCAALQSSKLAPAILVLRAELGLTLVQAGFALSMVQGAGMVAGVVFGAWAQSLGLKRAMLLGLALLTAASAIGTTAQGPVGVLWCRALEGLGFLWVVLPAPALLRLQVPPAHVSKVLGFWGAYMPLGTALALLLGPWVMQWLHWQAWWWVCTAASAVAMLAVWLSVAEAHTAPHAALQTALDASSLTAPPTATSWLHRLRLTLGTPGPWWVATTFALYSSQWLAVIGFLPTVYALAGVTASRAAVLTACVAVVNVAGNLGAGVLLARGVQARTLLCLGFAAMGGAALIAFVPEAWMMGAWRDAGPWLRFAALLVFSSVGGLVPATLFSLAPRAAPSEATVSTTIGWMQQWSALGQFLGPPVVAWVAQAAGGWQLTGGVVAACAVLGCAWAVAATRALRLAPQAA
jgi:MFS transporter, CP family, cyanate transporter